MNTLIFNKNYLESTMIDVKDNSLTTKIFYDGREETLPIYFKNKINDYNFKFNSIIQIKGNFEEKVKPFRINLHDSEQISIKENDNWMLFFVTYFLENSIETISVSEYENGVIIEPNLENYYIWINLSKDKLKINKLEFGRLLPLEKPEYKRKSSSWLKGVYIDDATKYIRFIQSSWDSEKGKMFQAKYTTLNKSRVLDFLSIPFNIGWTEIDYRLGKDNFYKTKGQVVINNNLIENTFTLLDIGEQDIPFFYDKLDQWIRVKISDSYINNFRRKIDTFNVEPIRKTANTNYS